MPKASLVTVLMVAFGCFSVAQTAQPQAQYQQLASGIFHELVEIKSTESGVGSTPAAEAVARHLLAAGFSNDDVQVLGPNERKKNLVARLHGKGTGKPTLMLAHLDVVEARRED
jgi:acetylornithine deacetylase/succinyl-diaminopimelate desuccinylase-like protein